jgi:16S rRNA A1518/A1519 N6-dimethyltransferase RsmA/KsgA/DIM1 with predicted DNA glycosylase/AP lyase activity
LVDIPERAAFRTFVVKLFGQRRKQLVGGLRAATGRQKATIEGVLNRLGLSCTVRAEVLQPGEFVALFRAFESLTGAVDHG